MLPRGTSDSLDAGTSRRILRTFLVVRIIRGSVLLVFLALALVGVEVRNWPAGVTMAISLAMLVQAGMLVVWCRRYASAGRGTGHVSGV